MTCPVSVVGGGLAGSEIALQLAGRGIPVRLIEMRPTAMTPAHETPFLAELVCSNSLKSDDAETASGLLKRELRFLGCRLLETAERCRVAAGHALAVDRALFAEAVTDLVRSQPQIELVRSEQKDMDLPVPAAIAAGPLSSPSLSDAMARHFGSEHLYFYDAISISVSADALDPEAGFWASRYGKGGGDYWNIPIDADAYERLVEFLRSAPVIERRGFENTRCFEACLPVEVIAKRGIETLTHGPMKPVGLIDPATGEPSRVRMRIEEDGTKERISVKSGNPIPRPQ